MEHLVADAVDDGKGNFGAILRRIDVNAKRPWPNGVSTTLTMASATKDASASGGTMAAKRLHDLVTKTGIGPASYSATRALSAGEPECAKWFVPPVNAPGTMMEVSMPSARVRGAYTTAIASIPAFAAKYGAR